jgi:hypothetical protein
MSAWDTTCCGEHGGGIWWRHQRDTKVTAINAGAVISAARLFEITAEPSYLDFAKKVFAYWSTYMVDANGHVYDGIAVSGQINTSWTFTYNEGLMIGAAVALAKASSDPTPLALAHRIAAFMFSSTEVAMTPLGSILSEGKCGRPGGDDGEMFKGIAARYLAELYLADPSHVEYRELVVRSAEAAWTYARDPATGLFSCDWAGPYDPNTNSSNSMSAAAMTLAAAARVLGPAAPADALAIDLEECQLRGVGLEASNAGFEGWGYLAGWGTVGQSVDCVVFAPGAGVYQATLRYATGDAASRTLIAGGATTRISFPSSGGYGRYETVTTTLPLVAGRNTVRVSYGNNDAGYVNLDSLRLTGP